ncbi:LAMI_0H15874g1_1 [Lachancea mirantina]|uniref:LAMI_0H15874g1_1 n=1 Tax=Lachancea mirantina TaxID=1230905 RepID=A0A1G4KIL3_9SACH|nr:LAMI_0H15874g1_1 [Lachancea mirantina]
MNNFDISFLVVVKNGEVISRYYKSEIGHYGATGRVTGRPGKAIKPEVFEQLVQGIVIPKVVHVDGNKVTKVSTNLIEDYECYYGTAKNGDVLVAFTEKEVPKILPLRILTELKALDNDTDGKLARNVATVIQQFKEELMSYHDPGVAEATEQDLQDIIQVMNDNIDKFLQRQELVSSLVDRTSQLNQSSYNFKRKAVRIKRRMWWQNVKLTVTIVVVVVILTAIIVAIAHFL